ncbi:MAG: aminodeoxychorismate/anthranilate synthase component II [Candidatus Micrarchaeota archaeon]
MSAKKKIFVVDAYDSFVYMLYQYLGELGAELKVARSNECSVEMIRAYAPDYILLSPGPGTPENSGFVPLLREIKDVPTFGVCLGLQAMAVAYGGKVGRAKNVMHGKISTIKHDGKTIFKGIKSPFTATRYHSLIVEEVPSEFEVSARSKEDGYVMAMRHKKLAIEGVQFHPESILTHDGKKILKNFLEEYK